MSKPALRVPQELYDNRLQRMKRLIDLKAPAVIIELEARTLLRSFHRRSFKAIWHEWQWKFFPAWLYWLTSSDYRDACREVDPEVNEVFEAMMREALKPRPAQPSEPTSPAPGVPSSPESVAQVPPEIGDIPV